MKRIKQANTLSECLYDFFTNHLSLIRGMSPHTIHSYRDTLVLLLRFVATREKTSVIKIDIENITPKIIVAFLQYLEEERKNSTTTRNVRLAAIHAFARFMAEKKPIQLEQCQRILAVPFKRTITRPIEYLEYEELQGVFATIKRTSVDGRRDYALFVTLFNTGARTQEILDLRAFDLQLIKPFQLRLRGKGRKERICPLWPQTASLLKELLQEQKIDSQSNEYIFRNHRGHQLTRYGLRYLLTKYFDLARSSNPTMKNKRLHPHSIRHSSAVHLLKSGVDITTISQWLGHNSLETTNRYATVDLDMKRNALSKINPLDKKGSGKNGPAWIKHESVLTWLESL
ncbi:MAG: site-specific integrase [Oligoflexia bacterium]|nr:site-specific integrase [Oligoflexia bacterium]